MYKIKATKITDIDALVKLGKYDWFNDDILKFPFESTKEIELIHFDRRISSEDAIKELDAKGLRPATATELLLLGAQHPELQRKDYIVALGTVQRLYGVRRVACLYSVSALRDLSMTFWAGDWGGDWRFAAVRKSDSDTKTLGSSGTEALGGLPKQLVINGITYERKDK